MKKLILLTILFFTFFLSACTAKQIHQSLQASERNKCETTVPQTQYDDCMKRASESYETYSEKRNEALEDKSGS